MTIYHTVYKTFCLIDNTYYIGYHKTTNPYDEYLGSGKLLTRKINKYGEKNFVKHVLFSFDNKEDAFAMEKTLACSETIKDPKCLNLMVGGEGGDTNSGKKHSKESIEKMSISRKNYWNSEEGKKQRIKHGEMFKGKKYPKEFGTKISKARIGKKFGKTKRAKICKITDPFGNYTFVYTFQLKDWCIDNWPNKAPCLWKLLYRKKIAVKGDWIGWKCEHVDSLDEDGFDPNHFYDLQKAFSNHKKIKQSSKYTYTITDPDGNEYSCEGSIEYIINQFNLDVSLSALKSSLRNNAPVTKLKYKGWRCIRK